ncbi:FkbM family methyltransferase [Methanosarcina sp. DH1]|uniref:FkbM family methyltransferase n=1 Tax=Methanosarcina sp. DH1 TaxID=2605695 RepID=UPI001E4E4714|nr:FkbM family methyltransferase [Methanosarcina sp. DH1]
MKFKKIKENPLLLSRYIKYKCLSGFLKQSCIKEVNGLIYEFDFDTNSNFIKRMYFNIYENELIELMKANLDKGSVFLDVGANVGYISTVGAGYVGKSGQVHSFEPVPQHASYLKNIKKMNPEYNIFVNNCGCSDEEGYSKIDVSVSNIGWNTMVPNFMDIADKKESIIVPLYRLDDYIFKNNLKNISFIKIDTEGYELKVLKGLQRYFENTKVAERPPIYCEIAPGAYPLLKLSLNSLSNYMEQYSYYAFDIFGNSRMIDISKLQETTNVLFRCSE